MREQAYQMMPAIPGWLFLLVATPTGAIVQTPKSAALVDRTYATPQALLYKQETASSGWRKPSLQVENSSSSHKLRDRRGPQSRSALLQNVDPAKVVWINSYARSSSSTLLSLVVHVNCSVFAIYEPCHAEDELDPELAARGCGALLKQLAKCNFTGVKKLWGWTGPHKETNPNFDYTPEKAADACSSADMIAMKTITYGHNLTKEALPIVAADHRIRMIDLVRDPRSIYASMKQTHGEFEEADKGVEGLVSMCDQFYGNMHVNHARVHRVLYEDLVTKTTATAKKVFKFLGYSFNNETNDWINSTFNGGCNEESDYTDCRSNSSEHTKHYTVLTNDEFALFMGHQQCRRVSAYYRWNTWYYNPPSGGSPSCLFSLATFLMTACLVFVPHYML